MWVTKGRKAPVPKFARNAPIILLVGLASVLAADPRGNVVVIDGELRDDFWRQVDPGKLTPTEAGVSREAIRCRRWFGRVFQYISESATRYLLRSVPKPAAIPRGFRRSTRLAIEVP
jgi:hypothetical protein